MAHTITDNTVLITTRMKTNKSLAIRFMLNDIKRESTPITPLRDTAGLRNNVKITVRGERGSIKWGQVYAQYQERGRRKDGTHVVKKYTTSGTGKGFAEKSVKNVTRRASRYFRKARVV